MLITCIRTFILYSIIVLVMRLMGKRQIGQLQPFELVIAIMISDLGAIPIEDNNIPLISGIMPIITLLLGQFILSFITLKSFRARSIICGTPKILIENGKIVQKNLCNEIYNMSDLLEQLRIKNLPNISDVEYAILETNGDLSIIPKSQKRPLTPADMNISTNYEGLPLPLVIDGKLMKDNLKTLNLTQEWLETELKKFNINSIEDSFFVSIDSDGNLFFQSKLKKEAK